MDVVEGEPQTPRPKTLRLAEPLDEPACECGFAYAAQAVNENGGRIAEQSSLQGEDGCVAADEAIGVLGIGRLLGQGGPSILFGRADLRHEGQVRRLLLIDDGDEPVLERMGAPAQTRPDG